MPQITAVISDDLDQRFRDEVSKRFGAYKRGSLREAIIEALEDWINNHPEKEDIKVKER